MTDNLAVCRELAEWLRSEAQRVCPCTDCYGRHRLDCATCRGVGVIYDLVSMQRADALESLLSRYERMEKVIQEQAEDDGLWFVPQYASEDYLQRALRRLHVAIEGKTETECAVDAIQSALSPQEKP